MTNARRLTGKYRLRKHLFGYKVMVEVYMVTCNFAGDDSLDTKVWKKARVADLIELGFNCA